MRIELLPHKGISIDGSIIGLGMDIASLNINYDMEKYDTTYYLFDSNLQIETENNLICSIMCCIHKESSIVPMLAGHALRNLEVKEMVDLLNKILNDSAALFENNHTYVWLNSDLSCWQEITPDDINEIIAESKEDGVYEEMLEDIENDTFRSKHFDTICIAKPGLLCPIK